MYLMELGEHCELQTSTKIAIKEKGPELANFKCCFPSEQRWVFEDPSEIDTA